MTDFNNPGPARYITDPHYWKPPAERLWNEIYAISKCRQLRFACFGRD